MAMSKADIAKVREFETLIDNGFRSLPIFSRPPDVALYGVLAACDGHLVTHLFVRQKQEGAPLSAGQVQQFKYQFEGLTWALRWLFPRQQIPDARPVVNGDVIDEAAALIDYGARYYLISAMYSYFSQGNVSAIVNAEDRTVQFNYLPNYRSPNASWGFHDDVSNDAKRHKDNTLKLKHAAAPIIHQLNHHFQDGRIVLDDDSALNDPTIRAWIASENAFQESFQNDDVDGFTIQDFTQFFHALLAWSGIASELYLNTSNQGVPQEKCMPTQVVSRVRFLDAISRSSKLRRSIVETIIARLTYDWRTAKPDVYLQPLLCGPSLIAWSPLIVQTSRFQRNLLKLMARTPSLKSTADRIIGNREVQLLGNLKELLERKDWIVKLNKNIEGSETAEVDLLATKWEYPKQVLIVEAKAFLQVDELNEIKSATEEMQHAQTQVHRIIRILKGLSLIEKQRLFPGIEWDKVEEWFGVIITPETEPGINFDHSAVPAAALRTLETQMRKRDWMGPYQLWNAMVSRDWQTLRPAERSHEAVLLAGVTFEVPRIEIK